MPRTAFVALWAFIFVVLAAAGAIADPPAPSGDSKPSTPALSRSADPQTQLVETIGLLAGLHAYQTYLNIGFLADGKAEGVYEEAEARLLLSSVTTPLDTFDKQLDKVAKLVDNKDDREAATKLRNVTALLRQQGKQLETFWNSGKTEDGANYEATRKKTWETLSALLGLKTTG